ncbi:MAG: hypothetical protein ACD_73C00542G0004, partial [uncultured bacterium]
IRILIILAVCLFLPDLSHTVFATEEVECGARDGTVADEDCGPLGDCANGRCTYSACPTTGRTANITACLTALCREGGECYCYPTPGSPESAAGGHPSNNCGDDRECRKANPDHPFGWCRKPRPSEPSPSVSPVVCRKGTDCADLKNPKLKNKNPLVPPGFIEVNFDEEGEDRDDADVKPAKKNPLVPPGYTEVNFGEEEDEDDKSKEDKDSKKRPRHIEKDFGAQD